MEDNILPSNSDYGKTATPHIEHVIDSDRPIGQVEILVPIDYYDRPEVALFDVLSQFFREEQFEPVQVMAINIETTTVNNARTLMARVFTSPIGDFNE